MKLWCALIMLGGAVAAPGPRFACTDYTQGKVFLVDERGRVEWSYDAANANDIWVLPNGNLLFNTGHGAKEVTRDKKVVFSYESTSEVYACQRLPNGNTFIGECNAGCCRRARTAARLICAMRASWPMATTWWLTTGSRW
jgi:hypothetical protein